MIDSEGVLDVPKGAAFSVAGSEVLTIQDEGDFAIPGITDEPQPSFSYPGPKIPEQLSAKGSAVSRKSFVKASPVVIPTGRPTVAFTERQTHAILRTISTETVQTSVHVIKALWIHAAQGGKQKLNHFRKTVQLPAPNLYPTVQMEGQTPTEGYYTDPTQAVPYLLMRTSPTLM